MTVWRIWNSFNKSKERDKDWSANLSLTSWDPKLIYVVGTDRKCYELSATFIFIDALAKSIDILYTGQKSSL